MVDLARRARTAARAAPNLRREADLLAGGGLPVAGVDEVGRGALAGPVTAGIVLIDDTRRRPPRGLRDSKLLRPEQREALVAPIRRWALASAVGHASAAEIDAIGILAALRLAAERALAALTSPPALVLLDGNYDWLNRPEQSPLSPCTPEIPVVTQIKADLRCASVAAASVLAKVERDALMCGIADDYPGYHWEQNKGYATPAHLAALSVLGPSAQHRHTWRLGGPLETDGDEAPWNDAADSRL